MEKYCNQIQDRNINQKKLGDDYVLTNIDTIIMENPELFDDERDEPNSKYRSKLIRSNVIVIDPNTDINKLFKLVNKTSITVDLKEPGDCLYLVEKTKEGY